jgi:hypothetical protein
MQREWNRRFQKEGDVKQDKRTDHGTLRKDERDSQLIGRFECDRENDMRSQLKNDKRENKL